MKSFFCTALCLIAVINFSEERAENGFTVTLEDVNYCDRSGNEYVNLDKLKIWPNLTSTGYIDIQNDLPLAATLTLNLYKVSSDGTSKNLFTMNKIDVCRMIEQDSYFLPLLRQILNIPQQCPIKKAHWAFKGVQIHKKSSRLSISGCFKCKIKSYLKNKLLSCVELKMRITKYMKENEMACHFST